MKLRGVELDSTLAIAVQVEGGVEGPLANILVLDYTDEVIVGGLRPGMFRRDSILERRML